MSKSHWIVVCLTIFGILFYGTSIENSFFIPFVLKNVNPELYPTDLFVNSQSVFHSLFFKIIGYFCKFINWRVLFRILHFAITIGIAILVFSIAEVLFNNKLTSYLTVFLFLVPKIGISLTPFYINSGVFDPSTVARFFSLLSICLYQ